MTKSAALFDLDRTVLRGSSTPVIERHLREAGLGGRAYPAERILQAGYGLFGESLLPIRRALMPSGPRPGTRVDDIAVVAEKIADELSDSVQPFVASVLDEHRAAGRSLVLVAEAAAPTVRPLAQRLGFDQVLAPDWETAGGTYTGQTDQPRLLRTQTWEKVQGWAEASGVDLAKSWYYGDSWLDAPLLAAVGHPVAVSPDPELAVLARLLGWEVRYLDKPAGVLKIAGREVQEWLRPLSFPRADPTAHIVISGERNIPAKGGVILAFNHRSYYDALAVAYLVSKSGRNGRFLGKKEVFDVPVVGLMARAMGGIRVDRGTGSDEPLDRAADALRGGDMIAMAPQGTIPRGPAFFDPELKGRWGAARLAIETGVPVVPVGIWGTEQVWPRNRRLPRLQLLGQSKPTISVAVGKPFSVPGPDPDTGTKQIMSKISALLPLEGRRRHVPTEEELARTYPAGYTGDPTRETDRRPGTDT